MYVHDRFHWEYIDGRLFYLLNIGFILCMALGLLFLVLPSKRAKWIGASAVVLFILVNAMLLVADKEKVKQITSLSPDAENILSVKQNLHTGEAVYYRSRYGLFASPEQKISAEPANDMKVEWLADDIAAITFMTMDNKIQQHIGTYGDRGDGISYYYVGAEIQGVWKGKDTMVISDTKGILVSKEGNTELFGWEQIEQFGTLAVVLMKEGEAKWTIALMEDFLVHSNSSAPQIGHIRLYKASQEESKPEVLQIEPSS